MAVAEPQSDPSLVNMTYWVWLSPKTAVSNVSHMSLLLDTLTHTQTDLKIHAVVECGFLEHTCTHTVSGGKNGDYGIMAADELPSYSTSIEVKAIIQETEHLDPPFSPLATLLCAAHMSCCNEIQSQRSLSQGGESGKREKKHQRSRTVGKEHGVRSSGGYERGAAKKAQLKIQ